MQLYYKRVAVCYLLVTVMFTLCVLRIFAVAGKEEYSAAQLDISRKVISIGHSRGTVFDCNMNRLTNDRQTYYAVFFDEPAAVASLFKYFSGDEVIKITEEIRKKGFSVRQVSRNIQCEGVYCASVSVHSDDNTLLKHIIGYTDSEGKGVCGIEACFEDMLNYGKENTISFTVSGQGKRLQGEEPILNYDYATENSGVKLTVDRDIQQIAEQEAVAIEKGAIVVTEVETGKIRAMVSRPDYKLSNLAAAVEDKGEPLINRAVSLYNIGSVFKPVVAAAGYDRGITEQLDCIGYTDVDGLSFACHRTGGHGIVDMTSALKLSCNCFFYQYIQKVGTQAVIDTARKAGFESSVYLFEGMSCPSGKLGDTNTLLQSKRAGANLSIGQGELMLSPLGITGLYMAIAGEGSYRTPSLFEGFIENGKLKNAQVLPAKVRVMSKSTAEKLKYDLAQVLTEGGTGEKARPTLTTAAGKTGTAQTGMVRNGKKVTNSWFCGFFPLDKPKYAVAIVSENAAEGCGGVFSGIADAVTELEILRKSKTEG